MASSAENKIDTQQATEDRYAKYLHCDICGELCIEKPVYISINKERYLYAKTARCVKCNKLHRIEFVYSKDMPSIIDNNDIRERIKKNQQSAFCCSNYEYFELAIGRQCSPMAGETFDQYKERFRKIRDDFYKENNICQKQQTV